MKDLGCFLLIVLPPLVLLVFGVAWITMEVSLPADLAKIEQLRVDSTNLNPVQGEAVVGQVTAWNQRIRSYQALNRLPIIALVIPDSWDTVQLIPVPR